MDALVDGDAESLRYVETNHIKLLLLPHRRRLHDKMVKDFFFFRKFCEFRMKESLNKSIRGLKKKKKYFQQKSAL